MKMNLKIYYQISAGTTIEENLVISAIKNMPISYFKRRTMENIITLIKDTVIDEIAIVHCAINDVDTHEMLKYTIDPNKKDEDIMKKEKDYMSNGKHWITYIPKDEIN